MRAWITIVLVILVTASIVSAEDLQFARVFYASEFIVVGSLKNIKTDAIIEPMETFDWMFTIANLEVSEILKGPRIFTVPVAIITGTRSYREKQPYVKTYPLSGESHEGLWILYRSRRLRGDNAKFFECELFPDSTRTQIEALLALGEQCETLRLGVELPCEVWMQRYNNGGEIVDARGKRFSFCFDDRWTTCAINGPCPEVPSLAYWGDVTITKNAVPILIGSPAENEFITALKSCAKSAFPDSNLEAMRNQYLDGSKRDGLLGGMPRIRQWTLSLYVAAVRFEERQREYQNTRSN
jgi:hypothetical protein